MKNKKEKKKRGFTLIELLAVIIILGILLVIAIPSVTKYITGSRKSSYISSAKSIISGVSKIANSETLGMTDQNTTYYIPAKYVKTENNNKSPYGEFTEAYVGVILNDKGYRYYWISNDTSKQGIKLVTEKDKLEEDLIEKDLIDEEIRETVETTGIEEREKILILNLDGTWQEERVATHNINEEGEFEPVDTLQAIFVTGEEFNIKVKTLAGNTNPNFTTTNTNILYIKRSKAEPSDENKQSQNIISANNSEVPIYAWFDNGTIYWWSEDIKPNLNSNAGRMFTYITKVKEIELKYIKTNLTTNMQSMFGNCSNLERLDVSKFDTSNVTSMMSMFLVQNGYEKHLKQIKGLENFDTSNVEYMSGMFYGLELLEELNISNFDTSKVIDMQYMFYKMKKLKKLNIQSFDTSNVSTMNHMFYGLESIERLDVSNFDTSKLSNSSYMFADANLTTIYASPLFDVSGVTTSTGMFTKSSEGTSTSPNYVLTGGAGTTYNSSHTDKEYARIDDPANGRPGYFTLKTS